jgi:hypothetical protein
MLTYHHAKSHGSKHSNINTLASRHYATTELSVVSDGPTVPDYQNNSGNMQSPKRPPRRVGVAMLLIVTNEFAVLQ